MSEELPIAVAYRVWMLSCPECGSVTDLGDSDLSPEETCEGCGERFQVEYSG